MKDRYFRQYRQGVVENAEKADLGHTKNRMFDNADIAENADSCMDRQFRRYRQGGVYNAEKAE